MAEPNVAAANTDTNTKPTILVTGGSGFLSLHIIAQALQAGYKVRTTVRSPAKEAYVLKALANADPPVDASRVTFTTADLLQDAGWVDAVANTTYVIHPASPFPADQPSDENDLIRPAVDGTLRVLRAAKAATTVRRVVLTSSIAAVSYGVPYDDGHIFTDAEWSNPDTNDSNTPYAKSKVLAEKAAWDFIEREGGGEMELATVNPVGIFGPPLLLPCDSTTVSIITQTLQGKLPAVPNIRFNIVDVRDAASLHLLVMTHAEAKGHRFICAEGGSVPFVEISGWLREALGSKARKAPTRVMPDWLLRLVAIVMPQLRQITGELGRRKEFDTSGARGLGWAPRGREEAIVSTGRALVEAGIVK